MKCFEDLKVKLEIESQISKIISLKTKDNNQLVDDDERTTNDDVEAKKTRHYKRELFLFFKRERETQLDANCGIFYKV